MTLAARETRVAEIKARMAWMDDNLSGCDWCCGGGDEEMAALSAELRKLTQRRRLVRPVQE